MEYLAEAEGFMPTKPRFESIHKTDKQRSIAATIEPYSRKKEETSIQLRPTTTGTIIITRAEQTETKDRNQGSETRNFRTIPKTG